MEPKYPGLRGPTMTMDTACSSSLVAIGMAHTALRKAMPEQVDPGGARWSKREEGPLGVVLGWSLFSRVRTQEERKVRTESDGKRKMKF